MDRIRSLRTIAVTLLALWPAVAVAWQAPPAGVVPITEARERADIGDYLVLEGVVVERNTDGLFEIRDDTGSMLIVIPEFITRDEGTPEKTERIRVAGKYDHAKLDRSVQGLRVMTLWRGEKVTGGRNPERAAEPPTAGVTPAPTPPAAAIGGRDAAAGGSGETVYRATAAPEMVDRLAAARQEWLAAVAELEEASGAYARALYTAGEDGRVDPAVAARNEAAEERLHAASARIPSLVEEARQAGVSERVLSLYVRMTTAGE